MDLTRVDLRTVKREEKNPMKILTAGIYWHVDVYPPRLVKIIAFFLNAR